MLKDSTSSLFLSFASLLEYPSQGAFQQAGLCLELLRLIQPEAANLLETFCAGMEKRTLEQMQELYTSTFDMQPVCYPYVGYHLFGESYKRGAFMAQLNQAYGSACYSAAKELPDHISVILRFLGQGEGRREDNFGRALCCEGLAPALEKMAEALRKQADNPYTDVLLALLMVLTKAPEKEMDHA